VIEYGAGNDEFVGTGLRDEMFQALMDCLRRSDEGAPEERIDLLLNMQRQRLDVMHRWGQASPLPGENSRPELGPQAARAPPALCRTPY